MLAAIVCQEREGEPQRGGRDGARTVADGCVNTPAMLYGIRAAKPCVSLWLLMSLKDKGKQRSRPSGRWLWIVGIEE